MIDGNTATALTRDEVMQLSGGRYRVYQIMKDGRWRTLWDIQRSVATRYGAFYSETTISARLRDLRKAKHGGHQVHHRHLPDEPFEYRLEVN